MRKKYFSNGEYTFTDGGSDFFTGYVKVENGEISTWFSEKKLFPADKEQTKVNMSDSYFDRDLSETLVLPHTLEECTFGANDFLKTSVINKIVSNLEDNLSYIYKNCFISKNDLPCSKKVNVLTAEDNKLYWKNFITAPVRPAALNKGDYPYFDIDGMVDICFDITDKPKTTVLDEYIDKINNTDFNPDNRLFAVFCAYNDHISLINLVKPTAADQTIIDEDKLPVQEYSYTNNLGMQPETVNNMSIKSFKTVNPDDKNSFIFKEITGCALNGDNLYVIDKSLNLLVRYDVARCVSDRGAASNQVILSDYIHGFGDVTSPYFFNKPTSVSSYGNTVAVLDSENRAVKVYDTKLTHKFTISHGAFARQTARAVSICPHEFILNGTLIEEGSIFIVSETGTSISIDIFDNSGAYIGNTKIKDISLIIEYWKDSTTGVKSSSTSPIYSQEVIKKICFSYNNSNYYYIITDRRAIKLQLSRLSKPIGIISYTSKQLVNNVFSWGTTFQNWGAVKDVQGKNLTWGYSKENAELEAPTIQCFAIGGVPEYNNGDGDYDLILTVLGNIREYGDGLVHQVDSIETGRLLYYDSNGDLTYTAEKNNPVYVYTGTKAYVYKDVNGIPTMTTETYIVPNKFEEMMNTIRKTMAFYEESNQFETIINVDESVTNQSLSLYSADEITFNKSGEEYVESFTLNKLLFKLYYNIERVKSCIVGTFTGGYSNENILTFNNIKRDASISVIDETTDFIIGENEPVSILLNRCFINLYNIQVNILDKIQTEFVSSVGYGSKSYKII